MNAETRELVGRLRDAAGYEYGNLTSEQKQLYLFTADAITAQYAELKHLRRLLAERDAREQRLQEALDGLLTNEHMGDGIRCDVCVFIRERRAALTATDPEGE